jgi:hypothetical protein
METVAAEACTAAADRLPVRPEGAILVAEALTAMAEDVILADDRVRAAYDGAFCGLKRQGKLTPLRH